MPVNLNEITQMHLFKYFIQYTSVFVMKQVDISVLIMGDSNGMSTHL